MLSQKWKLVCMTKTVSKRHERDTKKYVPCLFEREVHLHGHLKINGYN